MIHKFTPVLRREPTDGQPGHSMNPNWPSHACLGEGQQDQGGRPRMTARLAGSAVAGHFNLGVCSIAVVITSLEDLHLFVVGPVDQPVLVVNAAGPVAGQVAFEGLRLTYTCERVTLYLTDQAGDPLRHLPICAQPIEEVLPGVGVEVDASHYSPARASSSSMVLTTVAWRDLSRDTASMSRRALAGDRSR